VPPHFGPNEVRALGDIAIYVAIGLFLVAWTGFGLVSHRSYEAARFFLAGIMVAVVLMLVTALVT
jgi:hypothetical protein